MAPSVLSKQEGESGMAPCILSNQEEQFRVTHSQFSNQEEQGRLATIVLSNREEQDHTTASILPQQEGESRVAPSILSNEEGQCHIVPYKLSHKQVQGRMAPFLFSHKQVQGRMAPFTLAQKQVQCRMAPSIRSNKQMQGHMTPSKFSNKEEQDRTAPSVLSKQEGLSHTVPFIRSHKGWRSRMAHSILCHLERQAGRIVAATPRSCAKSGNTTLARSSSGGRKQTAMKRVSFYGLEPRNASKDDRLTTHSDADIQRMQLNTLRPLCRQMCLVKKRSVTTSNVTVNSSPRQTSGNLNAQLTNTTQQNVTDIIDVSRNNEQQSARSQVRRLPENSLSKQSQPNSRSKVSLENIYWKMSTPGACRVRSRQPRQKIANVYEKLAGKFELNKTHKNIQRVEKSLESQRGNNSLLARANAGGLEQKKRVSRSKAKLPMSLGNRTQKTEISNKIRKSSELSALAGNESPTNHTDDFRQYIQLTRSDLHPFDAERIRKDGSPVDPALSQKRTTLQNGREVNKATGYSTETTPAINQPAKEAHSSLKSRFSHKRLKLKKQRSTRTLDSRQKTGNVSEKGSHVEGNLRDEAEDRLKATSLEHVHVTDEMSGLTAAKQLQYRHVLGNLQAVRELSRTKNVQPPKNPNLESRLQRIINVVRSSTTSPPLSSSVAGSGVQRSEYHKMASPNLNEETSKGANVDTVAAVTSKQTAHADFSGDFCQADEYPSVAAQRRNAAYLAYANTGRRAELLGDVIEVVAYNKHSPQPCKRDAKSRFSEDLSAHKLKSLTTKNRGKTDSKSKLKPKVRKPGRLKRRRSKSAVTTRSKRHGRIVNITDNSNTKQMSTQAASTSKRHARMNRLAMKGSTRQQSKKARKPRCGISRRPRPRRRCKPKRRRDNAPAASETSRSLGASSHRRARPSKSKCRKKPSTIPGCVSHNAKHSGANAAKCELVDKKHRTTERTDSSNNKYTTMTFMFKRCDCLSRSEKVKRPRRKLFKPKRRKRRRRTNKQTDYFNRNNHKENIKKDMFRMNLPGTKPCKTESQVRGRNRVTSRVKRYPSPNMYLNTTANGEDDSDESGGLSGMSRIRTRNVSRPSLLAESNSLISQWETLLITEDT